MIVRVYYNLHKHCLSVMCKKSRRVFNHTNSIHLQDVRFVVSEKGIARIRREKRKSVIAFVEGKVVPEYGEVARSVNWPQVFFNPYKTDHFMLNNRPIHKAHQALIVNKNVYVQEKKSNDWYFQQD
jgi:hypothetical protein